jgi:hypothetical protein
MPIIFQEGFDLACTAVMNIDADLQKVLDAHNKSGDYDLYGDISHSDIRSDVTDNFFPLAIRGWSAKVFKQTGSGTESVDNQIMRLVNSDIHGNGSTTGDNGIIPKDGFNTTSNGSANNTIAASIPTQSSLKLGTNSQVILERTLTSDEQVTFGADSGNNVNDADTIYMSFAVKISNANNPDNIDLLPSDGLLIGNTQVGCIFIRHDGNDIKFLKSASGGTFEAHGKDDYELNNSQDDENIRPAGNPLWIERGSWHQFVIRLHMIDASTLSVSINIDGVDRFEKHDISVNNNKTIQNFWIKKVHQKKSYDTTYWIDNVIFEYHKGVDLNIVTFYDANNDPIGDFSTYEDPRYKERFIISLPSTDPKDISRSDANIATSYVNEHSILNQIKTNILDSNLNDMYVLSEPTVTNLRINTVAQGGTVLDTLKVSAYGLSFAGNLSPCFDLSNGYISNFSYDLFGNNVTSDAWFNAASTVETKVMFTHAVKYGHSNQSGYNTRLGPHDAATLIAEDSGNGQASARSWLDIHVQPYIYDPSAPADDSFIEVQGDETI